jgi:hypothetical protein
LSKKRYAELQAELERRREEWGVSGAQMEAMLRTLREVMRFDPEEKQYTAEKGQKMMAARRAKAAALGVSQYELRRQEVASKRGTHLASI